MPEKRNGSIRIRPDLLGILIVLIIQIASMAWWASRTTTKVEHLEENEARTAQEYKVIHGTQIEILTEIAKLTQAMADRGLVDGNGEEGP